MTLSLQWCARCSRRCLSRVALQTTSRCVGAMPLRVLDGARPAVADAWIVAFDDAGVVAFRLVVASLR